MLFVADDKSEIGDLHVPLQHGVRAADDVYLPAFQLRLHFPLFLRGHSAREIADGILGKISLQNGVILRGEHFRRGQIRRFESALQGHVDAAERHGSLSAAHVPLQQPIHARRRM